VAEQKNTSRPSKLSLPIAAMLIVGVVAAAYYQEALVYAVRLQTWDRAAPGRTVTAFLTAVRQGNRGEADAYLRGSDVEPLVEDGEWVGYTGRYGTTTSVARLEDLLPAGEPTISSTQFIYLADGAAVVTAAAGGGKTAQYRLERIDGSWKVTGLSVSGLRPSPTPPPDL
jgi:hypothetical protein